MSPAVAAEDIRVSLLSDIGCTRTENQDRCAEFSEHGTERLIVVADGMGGHRGGATAAQMAIDQFGLTLSESNADGERLLDDAVDRANQDIFRAASDDPELEGMGTTVVALLFGSKGQWVMHVGDSRAYRLRDGQLECMTEDHSTVMELVRSGRIRPEEADAHPRKNEVLRSLGVPDRVEPEISPLETRPGDRFLLCSDGLTGVVSDDEIAYLLLQHEGEDAAHALVDAANRAGGPDNVTVALIEMPGPEQGVGTEQQGDDPVRGSSPPAARSVKRLLAVAIVTAVLLVAMLALFVMSSVMSSEQGTPARNAPSEALELPSKTQPDRDR